MLAGVLTLMLSGCMITPKPGLKVWAMCYQDEVLLPNGMVDQSSILDLKCTGKELGFRYDMGPNRDPDVFTQAKLNGFRRQ